MPLVWTPHHCSTSPWWRHRWPDSRDGDGRLERPAKSSSVPANAPIKPCSRQRRAPHSRLGRNHHPAAIRRAAGPTFKLGAKGLTGRRARIKACTEVTDWRAANRAQVHRFRDGTAMSLFLSAPMACAASMARTSSPRPTPEPFGQNDRSWEAKSPAQLSAPQRHVEIGVRRRSGENDRSWARMIGPGKPKVRPVERSAKARRNRRPPAEWRRVRRFAALNSPKSHNCDSGNGRCSTGRRATGSTDCGGRHDRDDPPNEFSEGVLGPVA